MSQDEKIPSVYLAGTTRGNCQHKDDLNANDIEAAKLQVAGTARSMGIEVQGS